jgi:carbonic anhydrase/acetyltransferase-like protein (isoleucine patch superfamily)
MNDLFNQLDTYLRKKPTLGKQVYISKGAVVIGDVTLGDYSSVWYNAVLRADINKIVVGNHSNIQDNAVIHLAEEIPCIVGNWVTIGHSAVVHACTIGDECLIGINATILDGAVIGEQCIVAANAFVAPGMKVPPGSLLMGCPAKIKRALSDVERGKLKLWAEHYVLNSEYCLKNKINIGKLK